MDLLIVLAILVCLCIIIGTIVGLCQLQRIITVLEHQIKILNYQSELMFRQEQRAQNEPPVIKS